MRERTTTTRAGRQEGRREGEREGGRKGTREEREENEEHREGPREDPCSSLRSRGYFAWRRLHLFFATIVPLSLPLSLVEFVESLIVRGSKARIVSWNRVTSRRLERERHNKRPSSRNLDTSLSIDSLFRHRANFTSCRTSPQNFCTLNIPVNYDLETR